MPQDARNTSSNPFSPVFGTLPAHMAGCNGHIAEFSNALAANKPDPNRCIVITGARGTGKTALLAALSSTAEQLGWIVVHAAASPRLLNDVLDSLVYSCEALRGFEASYSPSTALTPDGALKSPQTASQAVVFQSLSTALDTIESQGHGLLITVDDIQNGMPQSRELVSVVQRLIRSRRNIALAMAAPLALADWTFSKKNSEFLHRAKPWRLGPIPDYEVEDAFFYTVTDGGKRISREALRECSRAIGGHAAMIQLVGWHVWSISGDKRDIDVEDALVGIDLAAQDARDTIARATYQDLSAGDVRFLNAMLPDMDASRLGDVARRMGVSTNYASVYKKRLLTRGVVSQPARDLVAFCLPGLREHLVERLQAAGDRTEYFFLG